MDYSEPAADDIESLADQGDNFLESFLDKDYSTLGKIDGFHHKTTDYRDARIKQVRSEFQIILDRLLERCRLQICELEGELSQLGDLSDLLKEKLVRHITYLRDQEAALQKDKELTALNEGKIMQAIHAYSRGYLEGVALHLETNILKNPMSIFNQ